jgi:hypothetical protein
VEFSPATEPRISAIRLRAAGGSQAIELKFA